MANLSITHKHTSINSYEGKWFEQTWAFEISSPHKSTHRCNLGLSDGMSFAITLNTWQLYFWENHCLPVASRRPSIPGTHGCPAWPDPHLFFFVWLTTKWTSYSVSHRFAQILQVLPGDPGCASNLHCLHGEKPFSLCLHCHSYLCQWEYSGTAK